jgi:hypothetical protein
LAEPEQFLARWSRLKRKARDGAAEPGAAVAAPETTPVEAAAAGQNAPPADATDIELPSIESLTRDSDYTPFLRPGVPQGVRNEALRKLYNSDAVFANLDGLLEYGEDFGEAFRNPGVIATVYRVLKGMPGGEDEPAEAAETAEPEAAALPETTAAAEPRPNPDQAPLAADADPASTAIDQQDETA